MSRGAAWRGAKINFLFEFIFYFFYFKKYILNKRKLSPIFNFAISASCGSIWQLTVNLCSAVVLIPDVIAKWDFDTLLQLEWSLFMYHFSILSRKQKKIVKSGKSGNEKIDLFALAAKCCMISTCYFQVSLLPICTYFSTDFSLIEWYLQKKSTFVPAWADSRPYIYIH